jgi:hypothetical protein
LATKKTSSPGTGSPRSRSKKAAATPEATVQPATNASSGGTAVATAREKNTPTTGMAARPNFNHPAPLQERIRQRAYELYQQRGGQHGFDIQDWLRAESEMEK